MDDQYDEFRKFTDDMTGDAKRRTEIEAALKGDEDGGDPKKKKKGGGKKKRWWAITTLFLRKWQKTEIINEVVFTLARCRQFTKLGWQRKSYAV